MRGRRAGRPGRRPSQGPAPAGGSSRTVAAGCARPRDGGGCGGTGVPQATTGYLSGRAAIRGPPRPPGTRSRTSRIPGRPPSGDRTHDTGVRPTTLGFHPLARGAGLRARGRGRHDPPLLLRYVPGRASRCQAQDNAAAVRALSPPPARRRALGGLLRRPARSPWRSPPCRRRSSPPRARPCACCPTSPGSPRTAPRPPPRSPPRPRRACRSCPGSSRSRRPPRAWPPGSP